MATNIYLPIEIKRRELYSRIYFAIHASLKGHKVTIGRKTKFHDFCQFLDPGNYIEKSWRWINRTFKKDEKLGHKVFYLNEEGLMSFNKDFTQNGKFRGNRTYRWSFYLGKKSYSRNDGDISKIEIKI